MPTAVEQQLSVERTRVRDLLRPQPALRHDSVVESCDAPRTLSDSPLPSITLAAEASDQVPDDPQLLSHDPTLTAFAQLGAFRLDCRRSFISLMDHDNQFILAEATRSVSLSDQKVCDDGDEVYLGARVLDMVWGVCPNTIQVFTAKDGHLNVDTDMVVANQDCYVMNDLSAIAAYKNRPYVAGWPHMRFYAEVPIRSPTGHVIGTFCVVDDKPRDGLDQKGLLALNEIASAIMKHLELIQMQHNLHRAEEMVKGLGVFVEGKSAPMPQWVNDDGSGLESLSKRPTMSRTGTAETLSTVSGSRASVQESAHSKPITNGHSSSSKVFDEASTIPDDRKSSSTSDITAYSREGKMSTLDGTMTSESLAAAGTKQLFSRASSLIREALDLDGILFVDAFTRKSAADPVKSTPMSSESAHLEGIPDTPANNKSEWFDDGSPVPVAASIRANHDPVPKKPEPHRRSLTSELLGYSTHGLLTLLVIRLHPDMCHYLIPPSAGYCDAPETDQTRITESTNGATNTKRNLEAEDLWAKQLLEICPRARSIIFCPLWDPLRDQWFAGSLAWTSDPTKILQSADVTYLAAFGSCIMSEKSRLDALTADRAKADFISSVSHELRSPLHGVLATAEALQETSTGLAQDDMIRTITICGEVLLDTMDQILDYAKTSNSAKSSKLGQKLDSRPKNSSPLDLSVLVESVMEGVFAGHKYRKGALQSLDSYTSSKSPAQRIVTLQIDDSGKGMSKDYLKYQLFTPFAQEDQMAMGTGLGLSIVRQLVTDLRGTIDVQSDIGFGTTVEVTVPIELTPPEFPEPAALDDSKLVLETGRQCRGLTLCLVGFEYHGPDLGEDPTGILNASARRMLALKASLETMASTWFGMEVAAASSLSSAKGDILVGLHSKIELAEGHVQEQALVIFEDNTERDCLRGAQGVFYLSQPAGPQKMARILSLCLDYNAAVVDKENHHETSGSNETAASGQLPSGNATLLEKVPTHVQTDRHSTDGLENGPGEIDKSKYLPPSIPLFPEPRQEQAKAPAANARTLTLPYHKSLATRLQRNKVLLVEDNAINMKILVQYMQKSKREYTTAANGLEALEIFQAEPLSFGIILMDLSMPIMDGLTSSRHIRMHELENMLPRTRIVALTCFSSTEYQRAAELNGVDMFLIKPVPMKTLKPILDLDPGFFPKG
ncbi:Autoinducer 2 sensor kinase phosphatase [Hyphodiscus hymeniophilus]|uniref:histidine kinase n=1 Tax=Hyphodiscus hymeniophilus TaxID=353542 RepID=A0A9P6VI96_9HELO|nr:Autoinducer 2 sensor kinase phosphatase [Hyphodiscus hymeniophilus]